MDRVEQLLAIQLGKVNRSVDGRDAWVFITNIAYDSSNRPEYVGIADQGAANSDAAWRIEKLTYDANGSVTQSRFSQPDQVWNDRESVSYS